MAIELTEDAIVQSFQDSHFEELCEQHHDRERLGRKIAAFLVILAHEVEKPLKYIEQHSNALGMNPTDLNKEKLSPQVVSTGVAHLLVPVQTRTAVSRIQANAATLS